MMMAKVGLFKCADSPDPLLLAQNDIKSSFEPEHEIFELLKKTRTRLSSHSSISHVLAQMAL